MKEFGLTKKGWIKVSLLTAGIVLGTTAFAAAGADMANRREAAQRVKCIDKGMVKENGDPGAFYDPRDVDCLRFVNPNRADERKFLIHGR